MCNNATKHKPHHSQLRYSACTESLDQALVSTLRMQRAFAPLIIAFTLSNSVTLSWSLRGGGASYVLVQMKAFAQAAANC